MDNLLVVDHDGIITNISTLDSDEWPLH